MKSSSVALISLLLCACAPDYSEGSRVGVVTKLSYKGLFVKSWEGEMVMGGMRQHRDEDGNVSTVANVFTFNVDPSVVDKVRAAQESGRPVELVYRQWAMQPPTIENDHVIIDVRKPK